MICAPLATTLSAAVVFAVEKPKTPLPQRHPLMSALEKARRLLPLSSTILKCNICNVDLDYKYRSYLSTAGSLSELFFSLPVIIHEHINVLFIRMYEHINVFAFLRQGSWAD